MAGSGAKVSDNVSAKYIPVVTVHTCIGGHAAKSSCKTIQPAVAVRDNSHGDRTALPRGHEACV